MEPELLEPLSPTKLPPLGLTVSPFGLPLPGPFNAKPASTVVSAVVPDVVPGLGKYAQTRPLVVQSTAITPVGLNGDEPDPGGWSCSKSPLFMLLIRSAFAG